MGFVIMLVIFLIVVILILATGSTSSKQAVLNTVGLDLSESAKERSIERDKIRKAQLYINSAESYVDYNFPQRSENKFNRLLLIKETINNKYMDNDNPNGGWYFTGKDEIQDICNMILDKKIKKMQSAI